MLMNLALQWNSISEIVAVCMSLFVFISHWCSRGLKVEWVQDYRLGVRAGTEVHSGVHV